DGMRERSDRVERGGKGERPVQAHEAVRGFESREAAKRRGNAYGAARVGSNRSRREAARDGDGRAARRAAGDAMRSHVPRVPGGTHRLVAPPAPERELDHMGLAERDHPGGNETLD